MFDSLLAASSAAATRAHLVRRLDAVAGPMGITFDPDSPFSLFVYAALTMVINGLVPVPLASVMCIAGAVLYGWWYGFWLNLVCAVAGCVLGLGVFRLFRPFFIRLLGSKAEMWSAIDAAIVRDGYKIPLLLRLTPVMPVVGTNVMLSLTSVSPWTYTWTAFVGFIPSGVPYVYAAVVGEAVMQEFPPKDPVVLGGSLLGLFATIAVVYQIGKVASAALAEAGLGGGDSEKAYSPPDAPRPGAKATSMV